MNRGLLPEMLHCTDMTVLERQRARLKWQQHDQFQQQQEESGYFSELSGVFSGPSQGVVHGFEGGLIVGAGAGGGGGDGDSMIGPVKPDPGLESRWPEMGKTVVPGFGFGPCGPGFEGNFSISRTASCPPLAAAAAELELKPKEAVVLNEKLRTPTGRDSSKKRKVDKLQNTKVVAEDDNRDKRMKGCAEEGDSKITEQNHNNRETSGDNSKVSEVQKPDYIHVRARRGQATDSHSLAERVRREKISERMKYLQDLVPGCNKITGKAGMLDEIINYVQSLQRQVEFLSMKLAAVNPCLDFNVENFFPKEEAFPANFPLIGGMSSEITNPAAYLQFSNPAQELISSSGIEMVTNPPDMGVIRRTISAPVSIPETFLGSSCFTVMPSSSTWDADLQNFYSLPFDQDRSATPFPSQQFTAGSIEASNLKMEM